MENETTALVVPAAPSAVVPVGDAGEMLRAYRKLQSTIDAQMPDCIVKIGPKRYRTRAYWAAVGVAFNLEIRMVSEERVEVDGDWGFIVVARATAPNGRVVESDGACMASEKRGAMLTLHNVRAHASTRAKVRAIADLVGFGEVGADELTDEDFRASAPRRRGKSAPPAVERPSDPMDGHRVALVELSQSRATAVLDDDATPDVVKSAAAEIRAAALASAGLDGWSDATPETVDAIRDGIGRADLVGGDTWHVSPF